MTETIGELVARGYRARSENRFADSRAAFLEAVRKAAIESDRPSLAESFCGLAQAERDIGNPEAASHHYANAAVLYRELKQPERLAYATRHEADILRESLRISEAEPLYLEAEKILREEAQKHPAPGGKGMRGGVMGGPPGLELHRSIRELQEQIQQLRKEVGELRELLQRKQ